MALDGETAGAPRRPVSDKFHGEGFVSIFPPIEIEIIRFAFLFLFYFSPELRRNFIENSHTRRRKRRQNACESNSIGMKIRRTVRNLL